MNRWATAIALTIVTLGVVRWSVGQVSVEEAQKRLQERLATRPASTQPVSELERLRQENERLRVRVSELQLEVQALRDALSHGNGASQPTTRPSGVATTQPSSLSPEQSHLLGTWRGGDETRGAEYILEFNQDGTYRRQFLNYRTRETGQYRFVDPSTIEMWTANAPDDRPHNQYKLAIDNNQLTLTPLVVDGAEIRRPQALVLTRTK